MRAGAAIAIWSMCLTTTVSARQAAPTTPPSQPPPAPAAGAPSPPPGQRPHNPGQEIAGTVPEGAALDVGPATLRVGGYVGLTGIYRSTNAGGGPGTDFGSIPFDDTLQGNVSEARLSAQSSRISIRVDAPFPEARFRKLSGYFEMDFAGATPGNIAVSSSSAGLRLRQAFADVQYGDTWWLSVGQAFTLMTPPKRHLSIWPSDHELSQAVDTSYLAGLVWTRAPQARLTWRPSATFDWAVSVENPEQQIGEAVVTLPACCGSDIGVQYNSGDQALSVPNFMPDLVTRVALNPTNVWHLDVGGVLRFFRHTLAPYDDDEHATGGGVSANVRVAPTSGMRIIAQTAIGSGLGRYVGGLAPDVVFRSDGSIRPLPTRSWVAGVEQTVTPRLSLAAYYSGIDIDEQSFTEADGRLIGFGFPGSPSSNNRRIREVTGTISWLAVRTTNRGSAQVGVQTSWLQREPWSAGSGPGSAEAFLFFLQLRYTLP